VFDYKRRRPRRPSPAPPRLTPLPAELVAEFSDKPLGGGGMMLPVPAAPPPQPPPKLVIPPPPWAGREAELLVSLPDEADEPKLTAFEAMNPEPPPWTAQQEFCLPAPSERLERPTFPPPVWPEEDRLQAIRDSTRQLDEPAKSLQRWPA
jgi:hypothetical protein